MITVEYKFGREYRCIICPNSKQSFVSSRNTLPLCLPLSFDICHLIAEGKMVFVPPNSSSVTEVKRHPFLTRPLDEPIRQSPRLQTLLADFRARGCGIRRNQDAFRDFTSVIYDYDLEADATAVEALLPKDMRRFQVLYCSFGNQSDTTFCEGPVTKDLEMKGPEDVTLRSFLDNCCFSSDDKCHHQGCSISIFEHTRRYCHSRGCVCVTFQRNKNYMRFAANDIITWSYCDRCKTTGRYYSLSSKSWEMSFAKFLQMRIYAHELCPQSCATSPDKCHESLFRDDTQYFAYKNLIAIFKYTSIDVREFFLPPPTIQIAFECEDLHFLRERTKDITMRTIKVWASVHEKLVSLKDELQHTTLGPIVVELMQLEEKERNDIRKTAGDIQVFLCEEEVDTLKRISIQDNLLMMNRMIAAYTQNWNQRIQDIVNRRKEGGWKTERSPSVSSQLSMVQNSSSSTSDCVSGSADNSFSRSTSSQLLDESEQNQKTLTQKDILLAYQEATSSRNTESNCDEDIGNAPDDNQNNVGKGMDPSPSTSSLSSMNYALTSGEDTPSSSARSESLTDRDDTVDAKQRPEAKATKKTDISASLKNVFRLVFASSTVFEIESPFEASEHYLLSQNEFLPVLVKDDDPGSVIAFTLASPEYEEKLGTLLSTQEESSPSKTVVEAQESPQPQEGSPQLSLSPEAVVFVKTQVSRNSVIIAPTETFYIEMKFSDAAAKFTCRVYFPEQFRRLRESVLSATVGTGDREEVSLAPEEAFIRSLTTCNHWKAEGGKSKSAFWKSADDRFVVKEMKKTELDSFVEIANFYFEYMDSLQKGRKSVLTKILGVYRVTFGGALATKSMDLLVMENLFYKRVVKQMFDLKGSVRNRLAETNNIDKVPVLQDKNLIQMYRETPLYVRPAARRLLSTAIRSDTQFLASHKLLDYSLLVGVDANNSEMIVGIIDYVRSFTWDKKLETVVKSNLPGDDPTIIHPNPYRLRFMDKMDCYFLAVPDPTIELESQM